MTKQLYQTRGPLRTGPPANLGVRRVRHIKEFTVLGLFDQFDHTIPLHEGGITIIHGPNGFGKTMMLRIIEAILRDQSTVLSVSSLIEDFNDIHDVYLSLPCVVDRSGVERFLNLSLNQVEIAGLQKSAAVLRQNIERLGI